VSFDQGSLIGIALIVLFPIIAAQSLWYISLEKIKNADAALLTSLYPLFAALIAYFALNENIAWYQMIGGAIMIVGLIISHYHLALHKIHKDHIHLQGFKYH
jgi:drug/metabolite transporter (DMT)-like permease